MTMKKFIFLCFSISVAATLPVCAQNSINGMKLSAPIPGVWQSYGNTNFSSSAFSTELGFTSTGIAFSVLQNDTFTSASIMRLVNNVWTSVSAAGFPSSAGILQMGIAPGANYPLIACDLPTGEEVMQYNSADQSWSALGDPNQNFPDYVLLSFAVGVHGTPYMLVGNWNDNFALSVISYDQSTNTWNLVGNADFGYTYWARESVLKITPNGKLYVAAMNGANNAIHIMRLVGGKTWTQVGAKIKVPTTNPIGHVSLAINPVNNMPYVEYSSSESSTVELLKNNQWSVVGTTGLENDDCINMKISSSGVPYLVCYNQAIPPTVQVKALNKNNHWVSVGGSVFNSGGDGNLAFMPNSNAPFFILPNEDMSVTVQRFVKKTHSKKMQ